MDHYKLLGLSKYATKEEIKEVFRRLATDYHGGYSWGGYEYHHDYRDYGMTKAGGSSSNFEGLASKFKSTVRFLTTRAFLLNVAFYLFFLYYNTLCGGFAVLDMGRDKSFEEVMESIKKRKNTE
ncbi:hypothetical protein K2173_026450 [Erythroxylum novogranatense]|uniref:J domain-containing protein n=1 Tax=Erythroxylum novogranatense TaxID=1862640 RepID=A0AAV8U013_9ROSI|nr:hypothetical protein K2173_026450 [Erythroxylum novogranatense]